jgi:hypothetical protein
MPTTRKIQLAPVYNGSSDSFSPETVGLSGRYDLPTARLPRPLHPNHLFRRNEEGYLNALRENPTSTSVTIAVAQAVTKSFAVGADIAREVDDGAHIQDRPVIACFTDWVPVEQDKSFVRLSEARTASHGGYALRAVVMSGIALERTIDPAMASKDIRHIRTMYVLSPVTGLLTARDTGVGYVGSMVHTPASFFDLSVAEDEEPYRIGPLYGGHSNQVEGQVPVERVRAFTEEVIRAVVG